MMERHTTTIWRSARRLQMLIPFYVIRIHPKRPTRTQRWDFCSCHLNSLQQQHHPYLFKTTLSLYIPQDTGSIQNPDDNTTAAYRILNKKNAIHTKTASCSPLTHMDTRAYYHAIYLLSIVYPFPSGSLQCNQCQHLQKQVKQAILPKCGYTANEIHPKYALKNI